MTNVKPATDEQVARFKVRAVIGALWSDEALSLIARIDADREENARLTDEAVSVGLAEDRAMKAQARLTLAQEEIAFLKSRYERDMCADGHERIRYTPEEDFGPCPLCLCWEEVATLKAEVERLTPAFLPCHVCGGKGISDIIHGAVVRCENCDGTGRAR